MYIRIRAAFAAVKSQAASRLPWLRRVRLRICRRAAREQRRSWRQFAHTGDHPFTVCIAAEGERQLAPRELIGMIGHEFGHIVGETLGFPEHAKPERRSKTPIGVQAEADWITRRVLGIPIRYNNRTVQELICRQS